MKRNRILLVIALALLALGAWYVLQPSNTPPPQPPLVTLNSTNFTPAFFGALNSNPSALRLLLLVSPT